MTGSFYSLRRHAALCSLLVLAIVVLAYLIFARVLVNKPVEFITAPVIRADIEENIFAAGVIRASEQVAVGAQVNGQLKTLKVALGDRVAAGQLLAEIDPALQKNELERASAQLKDIRAQKRAREALLYKYKDELAAQEFMFSSGASARSDFRQAKTNVETVLAELDSLAAQISMARIAVASAKANLAYTRIVAPIQGEVISIVTQAGQTLVSTQVAPVILVLAKLDVMTVRAKISEADVVRARIGQSAYFTVLGAPETQYRSQLRAIEKAPESLITEVTSPQTLQTNTAVYYNGLFEVPNIDRVLRTSMTAQVRIVLGEAKGVLTIPAAALGKRLAERQYEVRVMLPDGSTEFRIIRTGLASDTNVEIAQGLQEGETVVIGDSVISNQAPS